MRLPSNDWFAKDYMKLRDKWIVTYGYAARAGVSGIEFPEAVEPKYRCKLCRAPMVARSGPFGEFLACPKGTKTERHPTQKMTPDFKLASTSTKVERFHPMYQIEPLAIRIHRESTVVQDDVGEWQ